MIFSKKTKYFIFGLFIFFANNSYAAQLDLSSGQTWGVTRTRVQHNFDEVYTAIENTYIAALIGGNISGSLITSGTVADDYIDTNIPRLDGTHSITGTYSFPETAYDVTIWDALSTPVTKNSFRDYMFNFDADGDGSFTDESWFPNLSGKEDADSDITKANENETITGLWAFPDASYDVSTWDAVNTPVTKNSFRDYMFNFDADGDGSFTDESWFPVGGLFDPASPGEIGGTTPAAGTFTTVTASEYTSSATDGERGIIFPENTTKSPGSGLEEIYNEGGFLKYSENGVEKNFITIDDTAGDGDTTVTLSADKIVEYINNVSGAAGYVTVPTYSDSTGVAGQYSWDTSYCYICTATNTWDRFAITRANWSNPTPDTTDPTVTISTPAADASWVDSVTYTLLAGTASDNVGVNDIYWKLESGGSYANTNVTGTTSWSVSSITLQEGLNSIYVRVRDAATNSTEAIRTISVDTTDAVIGTVTPSSLTHDGTGVSLSATIASVTEANEKDREWSLYDVTDAAIEIDWSVFTGLSVTGISIPDDQHTYRVDIRATDLAGNVGSVSSSNIVYEALGSCDKYIDTATAVGSGTPVGSEDPRYYVGMIVNAEQATHTICQANFRAHSITGDISGKTFVAKIFSKTGTALNTELGSSNTISGADISAGEILTFTFSTPVETDAGEVIVITMSGTDGSNYLSVTTSNTDTSSGYASFARYASNKTLSFASLTTLMHGALYE